MLFRDLIQRCFRIRCLAALGVVGILVILPVEAYAALNDETQFVLLAV